ncbi:o-succinylbenzoate synthase [Endozoicomonas montiporae]|uniref:o-succinylbenzoate synthase n=1 Tax=Endozoicomonas montiporae CL-33 TaxID=570277 RepID=A0A142BEV3_9GAMM|nr:o-succinylbenzoate synthase [Endozoicomonas montiporae]AMO57279.1 O-succinylbenzoic acid (OSB) synthetase [Endozoicomonas montiporae CL-33]
MEIIGARLYQYNLPLAWPLPLKGTKLNARQGLVLELKVNDDGFGVGYLYGEAAPLPDFSSESLDEARQQLGALMSSLLGQQVDPESFNSQEWCGQPVYPSVAFALESAISLPAILADDPETELPVAPLLTGSTADMLQCIDDWSSCWPAAFKLKVARGELKSDIYRTRQLLDALPETVCLKLDANRRWSVEQAVKFVDHIDPARIAYIEEPVNNASGSFIASQQAFYKATKMPFAWDETLQNPEFEFAPQSGLAALVIKPTLVGGIRRCESLVNAGRDAGVHCVVSSSFESVLGVNTLSALARVWTPREAAGLDTLNAFKHHLFDDSVALWQRLPDHVLQQMELL